MIKPYEWNHLHASLENYFLIYPYKSNVKLTKITNPLLSICSARATVSELKLVDWNYFRPLNCPMSLQLSNDGALLVKIDFSTIHDGLRPEPFAKDNALEVGFLCPETTEYSNHLKRLRLMLRKNPWTHQFMIFSDALIIRSVSRTGSSYKFVPTSHQEMVATLPEQVLECFNPREPNMVNFTETETQPTATDSLSNLFQTLNQNLQKLNDRIPNRSGRRQNTSRRDASSMEDDTDSDINQFDQARRRQEMEDERMRREMSRLELIDGIRGMQVLDGFNSAVEQHGFVAVYGQIGEPEAACLNRIYESYKQTNETRLQCFSRILRDGLPQTPPTYVFFMIVFA